MIALMTIGFLRQVLCATDLSGIVAAVPDGQTLIVEQTRIRLNEIAVAAPKTLLGAEVRRLLQSLTLGREIYCRVCQRGGPKAPATGRCQLADGSDLGQALIAAGLARDCVAVSGGRLAAFETAASKEIPLPKHCRPGLRRGPMPRIH